MRVFEFGKAALLFVLLAGAASPAFSKSISLRIIHTNDIHGWAMSKPDREEPSRLVGGAAALANFVKREKAKGAPVLFVDGGDWFVGTPEGTITRGKMMVETFNALGYDATVIGNHEYDFGEDTVKDLVSQLKTSVLGTNIIKKSSGKIVDYARPYLIKEVSGVKIGVFGLTTSKMPKLNFPKNIAGLEFRDEVEAAKDMVAVLKKKGADVIVLLSHVGFEGGKRHEKLQGDQTIAREVPGIDVIVGGHTHTPIWKPERVNGAIIVQAWAYLSHAGVVDLEVDPSSKKVLSSSGRLEKLWVDELGEDKNVSEIVKRYQAEVGKELDEVIGSSEQELVRSYKEEDQVGRWMTDCMRKWSKTDVAIQNGGGIRANIPKGPIALRNMFEVMPFMNFVVSVNMTGKDVLALFDRGVSGEIGMIEISGARFEYDSTAPAGKRIKNAWIGGERLDPEKYYSLSVPDFITEGGDDYDFSRATDKAEHPTLIRDLLTWCVINNSPIVGSPMSRMVQK